VKCERVVWYIVVFDRKKHSYIAANCIVYPYELSSEQCLFENYLESKYVVGSSQSDQNLRKDASGEGERHLGLHTRESQ
jgi:hypothetical protein